MRFVFLGLVMSFSVNSQAALRDITIACELSHVQSAQVESVAFNSESNEIRLQFRDGASETLKPIAKKNQGLFGLENFSSHIGAQNGQLTTTSPRVGDIFIRHHCHLTPTLSVDYCMQGNGVPAPYAAVRMNIHGKVLRFVGSTICDRKDFGPF